MLRELRIRNLALIDSLSLEFEPGFTVFTGETGAGKSILIGAIGLLLGDRASSESVRSGCDEAEVSGVIELANPSEQLLTLLNDLSIDTGDNELIIRRRISRNDRSRIHVNETPLSLAALRQIGDLLIDLHGQHEHQSLLNEDMHRALIDTLDGVSQVRAVYDTCFTEFTEASRTLARHEEATRLLDEKREILEFQQKELEQAHLKTGEEEELEEELKLLSSSAQRLGAVNGILELLGGSGPTSIEKQASTVKRYLEQLGKYDMKAGPWIDDVDNALRVFSELETFCSSYLSDAGEQADPNRIEKINTRLAKLQRLKKKYGASIEGLIAKEQSVRENLAALENSDADRKEIEKKAAAARTACIEAGKKLSTARKNAAVSFDRSITSLMEELGFNGGLWKTVFTPFESPAEHGLENVSFHVRTNPGEAELPLAKTASGGEISRLMLAVKTVLSRNDHVPVLIFDEIDTGIGGVIAGVVGTAMKALSSSHQVLCISHLHQIASLADRQVKVFKEESGGRTVTRIVPLSEKERVEEIARMLGGDSKIAKEHARALLDGGG
ncbi:MAG: DNA repair protein RecN [Chitinispirillaceae bacterium]|nr:DNA repair protein RecN [Chitinispirillaceae bacterium]